MIFTYCILLLDSRVMRMSKNYIIEVNNLTKRYGKTKALDNLCLRVPEGSIYGLIGKNGAGKTTLIRILCGLQLPSRGGFFICGVKNDDKNIYLVRKNLGAIVETCSLYLEKTAYENMVLQATLCGVKDKKKLLDLLNLVNLENNNKKVKNFSLGMRERLGIAMTLINDAKILVLDEPTNGLDPIGISDIRNVILKLNQEYNITFIISSHYLDELSKVATNYGFIEKGSLLEEISKKDLMAKLEKKILIKVNKNKVLQDYFKQEKIKFKLKDNVFIINNSLNINKMVLFLDKNNCQVLDITREEESLEEYFLEKVGGKNA